MTVPSCRPSTDAGMCPTSRVPAFSSHPVGQEIWPTQLLVRRPPIRPWQSSTLNSSPRGHPCSCWQELRGQLDREQAEFQEIAVQQHLVLEQHEATEAQLEGQLAAARQELEQVSVLAHGQCLASGGGHRTPSAGWAIGSSQAGAEIGQAVHSQVGTCVLFKTLHMQRLAML